MLGLGKTVAKLTEYRRLWSKRIRETPPYLPAVHRSPLVEVTGFGRNPGNLRMLAYVPDRSAASAPLVVVLHGCNQTAASYDHGSGWTALARRHDFALLFPQQQPENNPHGCFNWFRRRDIERGSGEALSIREMVDWMVRHERVDRARIFVTGLSAGGAMTNVMLATYPDVFAGGASIAGLPYHSATNAMEAFESGLKGRHRPAREWGDLVRAASNHTGRWPTISIWHGTADTVVNAANADEIVKQWTDVHGLALTPSVEDLVAGYPHRVWRDASGAIVIEEYSIISMDHGTPLAAAQDGEGFGAAGPYSFEVGISSTQRIAEFWGLTTPSRIPRAIGRIQMWPAATGEAMSAIRALQRRSGARLPAPASGTS